LPSFYEENCRHDVIEAGEGAYTVPLDYFCMVERVSLD
jgi:hypothetical protein